MNIIRSKEFIKDIKSIKDDTLYAIISDRLDRLNYGNFGDVKSLGNEISELRIHYGAGYRVYFTQRGLDIVILLCAGGKSDQKKDLQRAIKLSKEV